VSSATVPPPNPWTWEIASGNGFTRVLSVTDPKGTLRIDGVHLDREARVLIEAVVASGVTPGQTTEFSVIERGVPAPFGREVELGGLSAVLQH
jgi:hypothetical protein